MRTVSATPALSTEALLFNFGNDNEIYGSLGAVIGFMAWMWLSTTVVLVGAELNAEIEHQTVHDTTEGPQKPLGARGAHGRHGRGGQSLGPGHDSGLIRSPWDLTSGRKMRALARLASVVASAQSSAGFPPRDRPPP